VLQLKTPLRAEMRLSNSLGVFGKIQDEEEGEIVEGTP
jgi:hypothetical protein